jgi:MoxR-like ATPase
MTKSDYKFIGNGLRARDPHMDSPETPEPYKADPVLIRAVNLASFLGRPLLLEGEAGSGKTRLARAVAYELGLPFYIWNVRSTSKAQEGLYSYDAVLRLHDVHVRQYLGQGQKEEVREPGRVRDYIKWGALGKAFRVEDRPAVVLIDEIDKADLDFPNDLLTVLDAPWEFVVPEMDNETVRAKHPPLVLITSNKEKGNLPAPFLRRCIYYFVEFPDDEARLRDIVNLHYKARGAKPPKQALLNSAAKRFLELRRSGGLHKKPGTSEFLDWVTALHEFDGGVDASTAFDAGEELLYPELLLKMRSDWQRRNVAQ